MSNTYTELEQQVIEAFDGADEWGDHPCLCFEDIVDYTKIPAKKLRGVVSSLEQKGAIVEDELPTCLAWTLRI